MHVIQSEITQILHLQSDHMHNIPDKVNVCLPRPAINLGLLSYRVAKFSSFLLGPKFP